MSTTFGYVNLFPKKTFATLVNEEVQLQDGIVLSGGITVKPEQAQELIEYLSDPANCGEYGIKLDMAIFYNDDKSVKFSGKITTPYVKPEGDAPKASTKARRTV